MLNRIDEEDMEYAKEALQLLAFSVRPMVLNELTDGVAVEIGSSHYDEESQLPPYSLLEILGPLVRFNADLEEVTLAHRTLKTYLTSDTILQTSAKYFHLLESSANDAIAKKCLTYLSFDDFAGGPCEVSDIGQRLLRYPFLRYATYHWKAHITELTDPLWKLLGPFLLSGQMNRRNFQAWVQLLIPDSTADFIAQTHPLYYAASFGLTPVVQYLLERGANTESRGGRYNSTALSVATYRGHVDIVRLLLCHGADPDSRDSEGYSVLHWAVACEQPEIKLLLEAYMCF